MSLISFHRVLIACAILFCAGFGGWELRLFFRTDETGALVLGCVFFVLALGLAYYLWRLNRFLGYEDR